MILPPFDTVKNTLNAPHLVILGAGASKASTPKGDLNSRHLPLMDDAFVKIVGLEETLRKHAVEYHGIGFESLYSTLYKDSSKSDLCKEIEEIIFSYFSELRLPDEFTIYDHLICSMRAKDVIATFNWDPFLLQAYRRNGYIGSENMPELLFLHGNVSVGTCVQEDHKAVGALGGKCSKCNNLFSKVQLLYPVEKKDYNQTAYLNDQWGFFQQTVNKAYLITVFGYGAPQTDVEAIGLMLEMAQNNKWREFYEVEIIDLKPEEELVQTWKPFIVEHHYQTKRSFFDSLLYKYPRRSCEAFANQTLQCDPKPYNSFGETPSLSDIEASVMPLVWEERSSNSLSHDPPEKIRERFEGKKV